MMSPLSASGDSGLNRRDCYVLAGFLLFLLIFFSGVLAQPGERCLGRAGSDARNQFYGWRAYGFGEIRAGRFPLWNPYEFLGMPFVASLQSAMFYPTNWLCAVLPLCRAINLGIILNLFLSGLFTYLWARRFGLRWIGAIVAAAAYVFGAPQFLRIFEGHWSFLAPMPWIPCILLCVEMLVCGGFQPLAIALGAAAVAMEWFGGNPQYAFYGGIAAVLYLAGRLWQRRELGARGAARVVGELRADLRARLGAGGRAVDAGAGTLLRLLAPGSAQLRLGQAILVRAGRAAELPRAGPLRDGRRRAVLGTMEPLGDVAVRRRRGVRAGVHRASPGPAGKGLPARLHRADLPAAGDGRGRGVLRADPGLRPVPGAGAVAVSGQPLHRPAGRARRGRHRAQLGRARQKAVIAARAVEEKHRARRRARDVDPGLPGGAADPGRRGAVFGTSGSAGRRGCDSWMPCSRSRPDERVYLHEWTPPAGFKLAAMRAAGLSILRAGLFLGALAGLVRLTLRSRVKPAWVAGALLLLVAIDAWTFGQRYLDDLRPAGGRPLAGRRGVPGEAVRAVPFRARRLHHAPAVRGHDASLRPASRASSRTSRRDSATSSGRCRARNCTSR